MEELVSMIVGDSTTLDVYVVVRLCIFAFSLEFTSVVFGMIANMKGR